ncbi:MAG TPA: FKBP-type peptidyl-prolyl cis-trans isomerase [Longimicrobiales bacterium]|nr:FKBP-type peptidyl-prolyl cis-trans isomerase [Longimicrobiales bacterium]
MTPFGRARGPLLAALACLTALTACGDSITGPQSPDEVEFNPALGIDLDEFTRLSSGVSIRTVAAGPGTEVQQGNQVTVGYELRLPDNTLIDASPPNITFVLGGNQVIIGFDLGIRGMRVGEQRRVIIPSNLGYGQSGTGDGRVPPNSVLIFDVTLLAAG